MVGKARADVADAEDGQFVHLHVLVIVFPCFVAWSWVPSGEQCWLLVPSVPCVGRTLATDPDMGLPVFGACVLSLHSRLRGFLLHLHPSSAVIMASHLVVVGGLSDPALIGMQFRKASSGRQAEGLLTLRFSMQCWWLVANSG